MKISIIAAMDEKRGIGKNGKIPWHIKEDLVKLKNLTKDRVVILGRKTYESMVGYYSRSGRRMPAKTYLVVTREISYDPHKFCSSENCDVFVCHSLDEAVSIAKKKNKNEIFIIGGGQIYQQALPFVNKLYLTIVEGDYKCDTFFPDYSGFRKVISEEQRESEGYKYKFLELER